MQSGNQTPPGSPTALPPTPTPHRGQVLNRSCRPFERWEPCPRVSCGACGALGQQPLLMNQVLLSGRLRWAPGCRPGLCLFIASQGSWEKWLIQGLEWGKADELACPVAPEKENRFFFFKVLKNKNRSKNNQEKQKNKNKTQPRWGLSPEAGRIGATEIPRCWVLTEAKQIPRVHPVRRDE